VILVSHDREFVDNTATSVLLFEGHGAITEIFGGFTEINHYLNEKQGTKALEARSDKPESKPRGSSEPKKKVILQVAARIRYASGTYSSTLSKSKNN